MSLQRPGPTSNKSADPGYPRFSARAAESFSQNHRLPAMVNRDPHPEPRATLHPQNANPVCGSDKNLAADHKEKNTL
jgi:hypothetical protein